MGGNYARACVSDGAVLLSNTVLGIGISGDFSILTSSEVGSLR